MRNDSKGSKGNRDFNDFAVQQTTIIATLIQHKLFFKIFSITYMILTQSISVHSFSFLLGVE